MPGHAFLITGRTCGARTRHGGRCGNRCVAGALRCRLHGGLAGRTPGFRAHPNTVEALRAGRARWLERQRLLKAAGVIDKIPCGRRRGYVTRSKVARIAQAQRALERIEVAKRNPLQLPAATGDGAVKQWDQQSKGEKLNTVADLALNIAKEVLDAPVDLDDIKRARLQLDCALGVLSRAIHVDKAQLHRDAERQDGAIAEILRRIKAGEQEKAIEAKPGRAKKP